MNWDAIQAVGELVAAGGVMVSLLYLAIQVRQNTRSTAAAASQDLLSSFLGLLGHSWESEHGARVYHCAISGEWDELSVAEQSAARQFWVSAMRLFEHAYVQWRSGLLRDETWDGWRHQLLLTCALPGFRVTWPGVKLILNHGFVEWVDATAVEALPAAKAYREAMGSQGMDVASLRSALKETPRGQSGTEHP